MIDPSRMSFRDWADSVTLARSDAWSAQRAPGEARWRDWAVSFLQPGITGQQAVPDPYKFDDWRDWAMLAQPMLEVG